MRVVIYACKELSHRCREELKPFGIEVADEGPPPGKRNRSSEFPCCDAALFELASLRNDQWGLRIAELQDQGVCVVGIAGPKTQRPWQQYSEEDLDGVVPAQCGAGELACALWSAHRQFELRRVLAQRVTELECKLQHRKWIEQAKSVLSEMMNITESDALRHLRREARNQRRQMHELARVVVEARDLFRPPAGNGSHQTSFGKTAGSVRPVLAPSLHVRK